MRDVAVIGVGMNAWGELWDKSLRTIFVEAALEAIADAGVDKIDSLVVGSMSPGLFVGQEHIGPLLADVLGEPGQEGGRVEKITGRVDECQPLADERDRTLGLASLPLDTKSRSLAVISGSILVKPES